MEHQESQNLELKSSLSEWKEIIITLVAFANQKGGKIIVGVNDKGEPAEIEIGRSSVEDLANKIKNNTDPAIYPSINQMSFGPGEILEIEVEQSDYKPVFAFNRAYIRVGKTNQKISNQELRNLIKKYDLPEWDKLPAEVGIIDIDHELAKSIAKKYFGKTIKSKAEDKLFLKSNGLITNNKINNAGFLLFAKDVGNMDNAGIKAARFKGDNMVEFIDAKEFNNSIIKIVPEAISFIKRHINKAYIIEDQAERREEWDYPIKAIREALLNAACHRDYYVTGKIEVRIFDDKLEIWSPGLLPKELSIDSIKKVHRSIVKNKLIAKFLSKINLIEGWGSGIERILDLARSLGSKEPEFFYNSGAFVARFFKRDVPKDVPKDNRIKVIIQKIKNNQKFTADSLSQEFKVNIKTIKRDIEELKNKNIIKRIGNKRSGKYIII